MQRSIDRILTTHVGSLPRPNDLVELYRDDAPDNKLLPRLKSAISEVVRQQAECGIDVVNDGEHPALELMVDRALRECSPHERSDMRVGKPRHPAIAPSAVRYE